MFKRPYILALVSFLLIPVVTLFSALVSSAINPEIAAGYPDYERNFWLLNQLKALCMGAALLVNMALWGLTCFFLIKSKNQTYKWLPVAVLGPFGLIILTMLKDNAADAGDRYRHCVRALKLPVRVALELALFLVVWVAAYHSTTLLRDLKIAYESATTGVSIAQIIDQQNTSSGMWAFSEGLETLYLVVLFYLLWPLCGNLVISRLPKTCTQGDISP